MKKLMLSLYLFMSLTTSIVQAQDFASVAEAYGNSITQVAVPLPAGCILYKDPDTFKMDKNWKCISRQREIYLKSLRSKDYMTAGVYAVWSSSESWVWLNYAQSILNGKKSWQLKRSTLDRAMGYLDRCVQCCNRARDVNIGSREAKKCLKKERSLRRYIIECLNEIDN